MKAAEYISNKIDDKKNTLKAVELLEKGWTLGEVLHEPSLWVDKELGFRKADLIDIELQNFLALEAKKEKYIKEVESSSRIEEGFVEKIKKSKSLKDLDDLYRPYKKKKKTKVTLAREAGLQKFSDEIYEKAVKGESFEKGLETEAKKYIQPALGFITYDTVLKGAKDILVEQILEKCPELRKDLFEEALAKAKVVVSEGDKFSKNSKYANFVTAPAQQCSFYLKPKNYDKFPLIKKGWEDNYLKVVLDFDHKEQLKKFESTFVMKGTGELKEFLIECSKKAFEIHMLPSITTEVFDKFFEASERVYLSKLKVDYMSLLSTPKFGEKSVLSIFEKNKNEALAVFVTHTGEWVSSTQIDFSAEDIVASLTHLFQSVVKNIALGAVAISQTPNNRKFEKIINRVLVDLGKEKEIPILIADARGFLQFVNTQDAKYPFTNKIDNESLAAFYMAQRVQDPLFQYGQHRPSDLLEYPNFISAEKVDLELSKVLSYYLCALGLNPDKVTPGLFKNLKWFLEKSDEELVELCNKMRKFSEPEKQSLEEVLTAEEFKRFNKYFYFTDAVNLLDRSRISVNEFSKIKDYSKGKGFSLLKGPLKGFSDNAEEKWKNLLGEDFLAYINVELADPFRDFRKPYKVFSFSKGIEELEQVVEGNIYWGIVTKFSSFGAFVDIGIGTEGLVHLSELSDEFLSDPRKVLRLGQWVLVKALKVEKEKKQLSFSKTKVDTDKKQNFKKSFQDRSRKKSDNDKGRTKKGKFSQSNSSRQNNKNRAPKKPFNNPFAAALGDLKK